MSVLPRCKSTTCVPGALKGQKRASDAPKPVLQTDVSCHVNTGGYPLVLRKISMCP